MMNASQEVAELASRIVLISDKQGSDLLDILREVSPVETMSPTDLYQPSGGATRCVVIDLDLATPNPKQEFQLLQNVADCGAPLIFVVDSGASTEDLGLGLQKAKAMGGTKFFTRPFDPAVIRRTLPTIDGAEFERITLEDDGVTGQGVAAAHAILVTILEVVRSKQAFTYEEVKAQEGMILEALRVDGINPWLEAVRRHHSRTYKHSLLVTGFAVAFAQRLGMRLEDQQRIARAGLLHDVGKAFTPLTILDKPGKLTEEEMAEIKRHPVLGHELLVQQGGFPDEILDCVRHHHEMLDGSGYPDGLMGDEIADLVRIITVADIYAALIEERSYKPPLPPEKALSIMEAMGEKLDTDLLRAFRSVASDSRI